MKRRGSSREPKTGMAKLTRRSFLSGMAGIAMAPQIVRPSVLGLNGAVPPSERIVMGSIGLGSRGNSHLRGFLPYDEVQIVAVCDPYQSKCDKAKAHVEKHYADKGAATPDCAAYQDFRELLARDDIDAVVIASPENWHALQGALAVAAGKDVYGEKALTLTVREGRALVREVRRWGRVFQVGTQQRSSRDFRFACELARNGYLGELRMAEVGVPGGQALPLAPPTPPPPDLDYDLWLGPAPYTPHNDLKGSYNWYFMHDYCAGWIESWGVHHVDVAVWGAPQLARGRLRVKGTATFPEEGLADASTAWRVECQADDGFVLSFTDNGVHKQGCRFEGSEGWVHVNRSGIWAEPASLLRTTLQPSEEHLYLSNDHGRNFLECIRTRRDPAAPVEAGHMATTVTLVADIATRLGREVVWDWDSESFVNDPVADRFLGRSMRSPWRMPDAAQV